MTPGDTHAPLRPIAVILRAIVAIAIVTAAVAIAGALVASKPEAQRTTTPPKPPSLPAIVAAQLPVAPVVEGHGTARPKNSADLSSQVSARVIERPASFEPGLPVRAGDVLLRLDPSDYQARADAADALAAQARAELDALDVDELSWRLQVELAAEQTRIETDELRRASDALEQGASSTSELERRTKSLRAMQRDLESMRQQLARVPSKRAALHAQLANLESAAKLARHDLERTVIRAPVHGTLQLAPPMPGELLAPGSPVARIVDLSLIEIPLAIPASQLTLAAHASAARVSTGAPHAPPIDARVVRVAPEADPAARTATIYLEIIQNPADPLILPGQFVTARIDSVNPTPRTLVPRRAIDRDRLFLAVPPLSPDQPHTARSVPVRVAFFLDASFPTIDPHETQWAALESPLPPGTIVLVAGLDALYDGFPLLPVTPEARP